MAAEPQVDAASDASGVLRDRSARTREDRGIPSRLYLVGFMGCGKSRIGGLLADALGRGLLDIDAMVEERSGKTIRRIFEEEGESAFRDLETECLRTTEKWQNVVIATGGGVMASARNRRLLEHLGTTVWLDVPYDVIVRRMSPRGRACRPLLDDEIAARRLYDERLDAYRTAEYSVAVSAGEPASSVAARILDRLKAP